MLSLSVRLLPMFVFRRAHASSFQLEPGRVHYRSKNDYGMKNCINDSSPSNLRVAVKMLKYED